MGEGWHAFEVILLGLLTAVVLLVLHKVRRIHINTIQIVSDATATRQEAFSLFAQLQALQSLTQLLGLSRPLPSLRGWAGSPDFLLALAQEVKARRPGVVVECSSGVSTLVVARCLQQNGQGHVYSLEHEAEYVRKTEDLLMEHGLRDWATVLHAPLIKHPDGTVWYDDSVLASDLAPFELLVVDGPPMTVAPLARSPALPRLAGRLSEHATIFADDAGRSDETEMVRRWVEMDPRWKVQSVPAEKGLAVLRR